jgi:peptidoglycan/xylan/chitin deacetylase (PgdA/CDA1 family)
MIGWGLSLLGLGSVGFSARWNWWRPKAAGLPVLMYHKIGPAPKGSTLPKLWVSSEDFRKQMAHLKSHGYSTVAFSDIEAARRGEKPLPKKAVLVTFDDGYENNYTEAYPVLRELGLKANLFVVWETIGSHNAWHDPENEAWQRMATWAQLREMRSSGVFELANHTMRHSNLSAIPLEDVRWEVREAKARLEDGIGCALPAFAYPYGAGAYVPAVRDAVFEAGHTLDFGIKQGLASMGRFPDEPLKRLLIRGDDNMLDFRLNLTRGKSRF